MTTQSPIALEHHQKVMDLAYAYRGYMRGLDTKNTFDVWYFGDKLMKAQEALGVTLVEPRVLTSLVEASRRDLSDKVSPHKPVALELA